jgi:hypothetical protein
MTSTSIYDEIDKAVNEERCWECDLLFNAAKDKDEDPNIVNLTKFFKEQEQYNFPEHFNGPANFKSLVVSLQMASIKSGFSLIRAGSKTPEALKKGEFDIYIVLGCQCSKQYRERKRAPTHDNVKQRKTSTLRALCKEELCTFKFNLAMYKADHDKFPGRWILKPTRGEI